MWRKKKDIIKKDKYLYKLRIFLIEFIKIEIDINYQYNTPENFMQFIIKLNKKKIPQIIAISQNQKHKVKAKYTLPDIMTELRPYLMTVKRLNQKCIRQSQGETLYGQPYNYCLINLANLCIKEKDQTDKDNSKRKQIFKAMMKGFGSLLDSIKIDPNMAKRVEFLNNDPNAAEQYANMTDDPDDEDAQLLQNSPGVKRRFFKN
jgi:hypothetical protein